MPAVYIKKIPSRINYIDYYKNFFKIQMKKLTIDDKTVEIATLRGFYASQTMSLDSEIGIYILQSKLKTVFIRRSFLWFGT